MLWFIAIGLIVIILTVHARTPSMKYVQWGILALLIAILLKLVWNLPRGVILIVLVVAIALAARLIVGSRGT
jgi:hypothetical protein